jgi:hypothetical protein
MNKMRNYNKLYNQFYIDIVLIYNFFILKKWCDMIDEMML